MIPATKVKRVFFYKEKEKWKAMTKSSACYISLKCSIIGILFIAIQLREKNPGFTKWVWTWKMPDKFSLRIIPLGNSILLCRTTDNVRIVGILNPAWPLQLDTLSTGATIKTMSGHMALESSHSGWFYILYIIQHATMGYKQLICDTLPID